MKAIIKNKKQVAERTLLVTFDLLGKTVDFLAGQFFFITLQKLKYPDSKGNMRHFSIVNSPNEKGVLTITTRIREESGFKKTLSELPVGSEVVIGYPLGNFTLPKTYDKPLVFVAGGIGITPFMSMLKYAAEENLPYDVTLIYSNRDKKSSAFLNELEELKKKNKNIRLILTMTQDPNWKGEKGRIDAQFIRNKITDFKKKIFYAAGPPAFNDAIIKSLEELKIERKNVVAENFFGY